MSRQTRPNRRQWVLPLLMAVFLAVPLIEVWILLRVGEFLGLWPTLGLLVLDAVVGSWLSKREGARAWRALNSAMQTGQMPRGELADAALVLSGGIMLVFPGFFTDIFGLFFLLPFTRPLARRLLGWALKAQLSKMSVGPLGIGPLGGSAYADTSHRQEPVADGDVIEGEVISDSPERGR